MHFTDPLEGTGEPDPLAVVVAKDRHHPARETAQRAHGEGRHEIAAVDHPLDPTLVEQLDRTLDVGDVVVAVGHHPDLHAHLLVGPDLAAQGAFDIFRHNRAMGTNQELAKIFEQSAAALELLGDNPFRANAHARVARTLGDLTRDVAEIVHEDPENAIEELSKLQGVGTSSAEKIIEYVETGKVAEHRELLEKVPEGLFEVLEVPGLGPKTVKLMWEQLGIEGMADLKAKLDSPKLAKLPRMGKKTLENLRQAIAFSEKTEERVPLGLARPIALEVLEGLRALEGTRCCEVAGSVRRGRETIGDLDFLIATDEPEIVREHFVSMPGVLQVLARGETKCSVRLESGGVALQADLRIVPETVWGAALLYFTGSKEHSVRLRELAVEKDMRLNEYGLFEGTDERPQDHGEKPLAAATEQDIYRVLGLPWIVPELREDRGELEGVPKRLIELDDVRAELHAHTVASDGRLSIEELAQAAKTRGYHTLAVTDHSQSQVIARGLAPERLQEHVEAIRAADRRIRGIKLLAGAEVDILADGSLDYDDELLAGLDFVIASPHASLRQSPQTATERLVRAIRHPLVHVLGHPTGRIINRREGLSPDMEELFRAAVESDTALELNSNWQRLDLRDTHLRGALAQGCKIAIDTDAHDAPHLDFLIYGILTARRAGLEPASCINTWPAKKLHAWLRSKR